MWVGGGDRSGKSEPRNRSILMDTCMYKIQVAKGYGTRFCSLKQSGTTNGHELNTWILDLDAVVWLSILLPVQRNCGLNNQVII